MRAVRVLIVDDDSLVRRALTHFLSQAPDIVVVGEADDGLAALEAIANVRPDVVIMDIQMPHMDGAAATTRITAEWPDTHVLAITTFGSIETIIPMLNAGASGYLLKDAEPADIVRAVHNVHAGTAVLSPSVTRKLLESAQRRQLPAEPLRTHENLTDRELEVVEHLSYGLSNSEIAHELQIAERTVKAHLSSVMTKWEARDRVQVLIRATRAGIIEL